MSNKQVHRIRHWVQDTIESGHWEITGLMTYETAMKLLDANVFVSARAYLDEDEK